MSEFAFDVGPPFPRRLTVLVLACPDGFYWLLWGGAMRCEECGISLAASAPTLAMEQRAYDEMAVEHRRRCPGDGA